MDHYRYPYSAFAADVLTEREFAHELLLCVIRDSQETDYALTQLLHLIHYCSFPKTVARDLLHKMKAHSTLDYDWDAVFERFENTEVDQFVDRLNWGPEANSGLMQERLKHSSAASTNDKLPNQEGCVQYKKALLISPPSPPEKVRRFAIPVLGLFLIVGLTIITRFAFQPNNPQPVTPKSTLSDIEPDIGRGDEMLTTLHQFISNKDKFQEHLKESETLSQRLTVVVDQEAAFKFTVKPISKRAIDKFKKKESIQFVMPAKSNGDRLPPFIHGTEGIVEDHLFGIF